MVLKRQKKPTRDDNNEEEEDKISCLPDALIHHIYSFLPTKCVLSTCILSKRWMDLSNSVPILDFLSWKNLEFDALAVQKFMNFVDTVLFVHEKPKIQKFLLSVDDDGFDDTRVNRWIGIVIKRKVEELVLSMTSDKPFIFPLSFFTCDSLIVLDLTYHRILNLPNTISFPRLKILRLRNINFENENLTAELFSNCPILEELSLVECEFLNSIKVLRIESPNLKHLSMMNCRLLHSTLKICAPSLLTFNYDGEKPPDVVLDSFPSLVEAHIGIFNNQDHARTYAPLIEFYRKLCNVKLLKMCGSSYPGLSAANILIADLSTFCNLVSLEVSSAFRGSWDMHASFVSSMRIFMWLLQLSPNLESIVFTQGIQSEDEDIQDDSWTVNSLSQYSLPNLKLVVIRGFTGCEVELDVVKFFLANAGVLQTMTIMVSESLSYKKQIEIASKLLKFPRSSASCALDFFTPE